MRKAWLREHRKMKTKRQSLSQAGNLIILPVTALALLLAASPASAQLALPDEPDRPALEDRIEQEAGATHSRFAILAYKPNYLLPATYAASPGNPAYDSSRNITGGRNLDNLEVKFQISFKIPLWEGLLGGKADIYAAYSQLALWQAYNARISAPFREINYEPEVFVRYLTDVRIFGARLKRLTFGFNHQSNGQIEPQSRSWNRVIAGAALQKGKNYFMIRQWLRMPERARSDDNPGMGKYMGYGDLQFLRSGKGNSFSLMLRNNLRSRGNKGAIQADWTFPIHKRLRGYVQYFNGYGETLINYDRPNSRVGLGVALTDWL